MIIGQEMAEIPHGGLTVPFLEFVRCGWFFGDCALVRRYDQMEGVSERLGVRLESRSGSFLCEKGVSNGGTLRESSE